MTLAQALATSPNTAFVALEDQVGLQKVAEMAVRLGLRGYSLDAGLVDPAFASAGTDYTAQVVAQKMASFTLGRLAGQPAGAGQCRRHPELRRQVVPTDADRHHHRSQRQVRHLGQDALRPGRSAGTGPHPGRRHGG